jgi:predicted nuclease of predicted toxin-antitoxin system
VKFLVDMNLSPDWVASLTAQGWQAVHWQRIGLQNAADAEIFTWAKEQQSILLTQDLDFADLAVRSTASQPSIILLRLRNELDVRQRDHVLRCIHAAETALQRGAILIVEPNSARVRSLPIE